LNLQREALSSTGMVCLTWDSLRLYSNLGLVICACAVRTISLWALPLGLGIAAVLGGVYYIGLGFFLGSISGLEFALCDRPPFDQA
jgi:hypothetical protein